MITPVSPLNQPWTREDLTGNSSFIQTDSVTIFVISNSQTDNTFHIYKSSDNGVTFTTVKSYQFALPNPEFDPVSYYDGTNIYIIGMQPNLTNNALSDLVAFEFNPSTYILSTPVPLVIGSRTRSAYDITQLADSSFVIIVAAVDPINPKIDGNAILELHLNSSFNAVLHVLTLDQSPSLSGNMFGAVSLSTLNGVTELLYTSHQKEVVPNKTLHYIYSTTRDNSLGVWGTPVPVYNYIGDLIDDKLTVVGYHASSTIKMFTHLYYNRVGFTLQSVLVLGYYNGTVWTIKTLTDENIAEPTLCLDTAFNWRLAYIRKINVTDSYGSMHVFDLNPATFILTDRPGHFNLLSVTWIRGTKYQVGTDSKWMVIVEDWTSTPGSFNPYFVSEKNVPPNGAIAPVTATIQRNTPTIFDASGSFDQDYDTLAFSWNITNLNPSISPNHITILSTGSASPIALVTVDKAIGPLARTFQVQVSVQDLNTFSSPINPPSVVSALVSLPFKAAPVVTWPSDLSGNPLPVPGTRNETLLLIPTIIDSIGDLTYSWTQIKGTPVEVIGYSNGPILEVGLFGTKVLGETLEFQLIVNDGVNSPVVSVISVTVPSVVLTYLDVNRTSRMFWVNNSGAKMTIANRNSSEVWTSSYPSYSSDFFRLRTSLTSSGSDRQTAISTSSVLVTGQNEMYYRKRLLPNASPNILDGWQTENDYTLVLDNTGLLSRYEQAGPDNCSDYPQHTINVGAYLGPNNITKMTVNGLFNNKRVIAIHSTVGLLLIQINETTFEIEEDLMLSLASFSMYGANNVQFVKFSGVESLHLGKLLVGTTNGTDTFETLFDLPVDTATGALDRTNRINTNVHTGEILTGNTINYSGLPPTPVASVSAPTVNTYPVSWTELRPDLISSYEMVGETYGDPAFVLIQKINSGAIQTAYITPPTTEAYLIKIRALNPDGASPYSNVVYLGVPPAPILDLTYEGTDPSNTDNTLYTVSWTQDLPEMVTGFVIQQQLQGATDFSLSKSVNSGVYTTSISVPSSISGSVVMFASGIFGNSDYSNYGAYYTPG